MASNIAAEIGPQKFPWWPDWRVQCCAIVASGPSASKDEVAKLRDRIHVIAIKESVNLCPWSDVVYGCDGPWWRHRRGLPEFKGVKLTYDAYVSQQFRLHRVEIKTVQNVNDNHKVDRLFTDDPLTIGNGGNSGFQAFNLAVQFGVNGILLVGFDMQGRGGQHWYGRNTWAMANNPDESNFVRWRPAFNAIAPDCERRGIAVVDTSLSGALKCFPKMTVDHALTKWGL